MFLPGGVYSLALVYAPISVWSFLSLQTGRPGSDHKCLASKVFLQTSGARAVFWAFNDNSRARLYLDLVKEVDDVSAAAENERRSQHEE